MQHNLGSSAAASKQTCRYDKSMFVWNKSACIMSHHTVLCEVLADMVLSDKGAIEPYHILPHILSIQQGVILFFIRRYVHRQLRHADPCIAVCS